jgi:cysteinyl-tRNA synthetase
MNEARESLGRIDDWLRRLREIAGDKSDIAPGHEFEDALDDDLNISAALGFLFETIRETNRAMDRGELDPATAGSWLQWWNRVDAVLALGGQEIEIPPAVLALAKEREQARLAKDWKKSDELRDQLSALGWEVRDSKDGQKITKRAGA